MPFQPESRVEQVAAHLREQLQQGRWSGTMPGALKLESEVGASHTIVDRALRLLEKEGLLLNQGPGRKRRILAKHSQPTQLHIHILLYDVLDISLYHLIDQLHQAGHNASFSNKSMQDLGMDLKRITRYVKSNPADAWIVIAGPRQVLEWFANQSVPTFALYGGIKHVPLASAGPRKLPAAGQLLGKLIEMGHRRIVSIVREERRKPSPSGMEQFFLQTLEDHGIATGPYNLPDWGDTPQDLVRLLDSLIEHTPPTALILDEPAIFLAARDHLARRGMSAPDQISLACHDGMDAFQWQQPTITHIRWNMEKAVKSVVRWANQVAKGKDPRGMTLVDSELIMGGTIGPAPS